MLWYCLSSVACIQSFFSAFSAVLCFLGLPGAAFLGLEGAALVGLAGFVSVEAAVTPFFGLDGLAWPVSSASLKDFVASEPFSVGVLSVLGFFAPFLGEPAACVSSRECLPVSAVVSLPSAAGTTCPGVSSVPLPFVVAAFKLQDQPRSQPTCVKERCGLNRKDFSNLYKPLEVLTKARARKREEVTSIFRTKASQDRASKEKFVLYKRASPAVPFFKATSSFGVGALAASAANFSASLVSAAKPLLSAAAFVMMSLTKLATKSLSEVF